MEYDLFFVDGVLVIAMMALLASLGPVIAALLEKCCPSLYRNVTRFPQRHPGLFTESEDFYCFFHKDALYGN